MLGVIDINGYERITKFIDGRQKQQNAVRVGEITDAGGCLLGDLLLYPDDLVFAQHLLTGYSAAGDRVIPPVQAGDKVLVIKLSDECFAVVAKLTERS